MLENAFVLASAGTDFYPEKSINSSPVQPLKVEAAMFVRLLNTHFFKLVQPEKVLDPRFVQTGRLTDVNLTLFSNWDAQSDNWVVMPPTGSDIDHI